MRRNQNSLKVWKGAECKQINVYSSFAVTITNNTYSSQFIFVFCFPHVCTIYTSFSHACQRMKMNKINEMWIPHLLLVLMRFHQHVVRTDFFNREIERNQTDEKCHFSFLFPFEWELYQRLICSVYENAHICASVIWQQIMRSLVDCQNRTISFDFD